MTINYALSGLSSQGARWKVHHDILKSNGKKAVSVDIEGTILQLSTRKTALPAPELRKIFDLIPRTAEFEQLPENAWRR